MGADHSGLDLDSPVAVEFDLMIDATPDLRYLRITQSWPWQRS
jgi:hypothetical protein